MKRYEPELSHICYDDIAVFLHPPPFLFSNSISGGEFYLPYERRVYHGSACCDVGGELCVACPQAIAGSHMKTAAATVHCPPRAAVRFWCS